jgi:hypothetical protein
MKKTKAAIVGLIAIACFTTLFIVVLNPLNQGVGPSSGGVNNISIIVDYGDGTKKVREKFSLPVGKTTAFDALNKWCDVQYKDYGLMGYFVTSIDGKSGNWIYFVNNQSPNVSSTKFYLKDGDMVKWVRT